MSVLTQVESEAREVLRAAQELFAQRPHWTQFFRELLGCSGLMYTTFKTREERDEFEATPEYRQLQAMLAELRCSAVDEPKRELIRVVTVRMSAEVHEALRAEAHERRTSLNKLCVTKLIQPIDATLVPSDSKLPKELTDSAARRQ